MHSALITALFRRKKFPPSFSLMTGAYGSNPCSIVPARALGSPTPTFTRSTVATNTVINGDGTDLQVAVLASEARFKGRRESTVLGAAASEDLSVSSWSKVRTTATAGKLTEDATAGNSHFAQVAFASSPAGTYFAAAEFKAAERTLAVLRMTVDSTTLYSVFVDLADGSIYSTSGTPPFYAVSSAQTSDGYWKLYLRATHVSGNIGVAFSAAATKADSLSSGMPVYNGDITKGILVRKMQLSNVTGMTNQLPEYVSVGAVPSPSADNYFLIPAIINNTCTSPNTSITGNFRLTYRVTCSDWTPAVATLITSKQSGNNGFALRVDANGKLSLIVGNGTVNTAVQSNSATNFIDGSTHTIEVLWEDGVGATFFFDGVQDGARVASAVTLTNGVAVIQIRSDTSITLKAYSLIITNNAGTTYYNFDPTRFTSSVNGSTMTSVNGEVWTISATNVGTMAGARITNDAFIAFHGAGVDGVAYKRDFNGITVTDNVVTEAQGAAIPAASLLGYLSEPAATQLIAATADIRDMTTASWALGATMTRARTSVGADGTPNTATRLTGGAVAAANTILYTLTAAASSRTYSVKIKRITGTGPVRLTQDGGATSTDISAQLSTSQYVTVQLNQSQLNAAFGIMIDTDGDAVDADFNQFEALEQATSCILTGGGTRNGDVLSYALAGNGLSSVGTMYSEVTPNAGSGIRYVMEISDGSTANRCTLFTNGAGATLGVRVISGTTTQLASAGGATPAAGIKGKYALTWSSLGATSYLNGTPISTVGAITPPVGMNKISISIDGVPSSGVQGNSYNKNIKIYTGQLSTSQVASL